MTRLLLCTATILALTASANAQREGGAYFGPFSRGDSSGGNFSGTHPCTYTTIGEVPRVRAAEGPPDEGQERTLTMTRLLICAATILALTGEEGGQS
jgi:hypothetical protein